MNLEPRTKQKIGRLVGLCLVVAGGCFTLGAVYLPAPLFWIAAIAAVICAIVAVVAVMWGEAAVEARAGARAHAREDDMQWSPEQLAKMELDANPAGQDPDHPYLDPLTGVRSSVPFLPNGIVRGAAIPSLPGASPGRLVESLRFDRPITVGPDWDREASDILAAMEAARRKMDEPPLYEQIPLPPPGCTPLIPVTDYGRIPMTVGGVTTARRTVEVHVTGRNVGKTALAMALGSCTRDSGSSPAASAPDFTQEAHSEPQPPGFGPEYAVSGELPGTTPGALGHGASVIADQMARRRQPGYDAIVHAYGDRVEECRLACEDAVKGGAGVVRVTEQGAERIPPQAFRTDPVAETRQENRRSYWAERARVLLEEQGAGLPELFRETLEAAAITARDVSEQALQLAQEIEQGAPGVPLLGFSERHPNAVTADSAMAVIAAHRDHAGPRALLLAAMVKQQADRADALQARMVGQIGMALGAQRTMAMAEAEAEVGTMPLQERLTEAGPRDVFDALRALGWVVTLQHEDGSGKVERLWTQPLGTHFGSGEGH